MSLPESCADLARWLPEAAALITVPDDDGYTGHGQPSSRPPGNTAAFNATMDACEGVLRLEASLRVAVTGRPGFRRGYGSTGTALAAIGRLGEAVTEEARTAAARYLDRFPRAIRQLPAIDEEEAPQRIPVPCPYCGRKMLRVFPRGGTVTCLAAGSCFDGDGRHPVGMMEVGRLGPQVRWADGLVAP